MLHGQIGSSFAVIGTVSKEIDNSKTKASNFLSYGSRVVVHFLTSCSWHLSNRMVGFILALATINKSSIQVI